MRGGGTPQGLSESPMGQSDKGVYWRKEALRRLDLSWLGQHEERHKGQEQLGE